MAKKYFLINSNKEYKASFTKSLMTGHIGVSGLPLEVVQNEDILTISFNGEVKDVIPDVSFSRTLENKGFETPYGRIILPEILDVSTSAGRFLFVPA